MGLDFARAAESLADPKTRRRKSMSLEDVKALIATCDRGRPMDLRDRAVMVVALRTGLRASNLVGLSWGGIKGRVADCIIKGGKHHQVILDDRCLDALQSWGSWLEASGKSLRGPVMRRISETVSGDYIVGNVIRRRQWVNDMLKSRAAEARIGNVHAHLFRHTFVSWALEAGVPPHRVMRQTGHSNMATLSQYVTDLEAETNPIGNHLPEF